MSGDTLVVGAWFEDSNATGVNGDQSNNGFPDSGAAYVFVRTGTTWSQQAYLKASNSGVSFQFGAAVAVSGDTIVVGAYGEDSNATGVNGDQTNLSAGNSGAAYVFVRAGTAWSQQAYLKASNTGTGDWFGLAVAASGDTVVVSAYEEDSDGTSQFDNSATGAGAAYVFARNGTSWSPQAYLKGIDTDLTNGTNGGDHFGYSVAASGDTVVVGAYLEDSAATGVNGNQGIEGATGSGAAFVFVRTGVVWSQQAYLKASNTGAGDAFGSSVSVSGNTVVVGAGNVPLFGAGEDSNATGVNGDQSNNSALNSGAAYVFTRSGATWSQLAYLKASNTEANDEFGHSVAVSGDTVVVGAPLEDSSATGVNGNQADNSIGNAGAAYVFDLDLSSQTYCTAGVSTNGCVAQMSGNGTPSASLASNFTISCDQLEGQKAGLMFYGISGSQSAPWSSGSSFLCVKSPTQRFDPQISGGVAGQCDGSFSVDWNTYQSSHPGALGQPFSAGQTVWAQAWYRDPPAPKTTNLSDGLSFTLAP